MMARLYDHATAAGPESIGEHSVVRLVHGIHVETLGRLPEGCLGAVVFVHNEGEAYEVEFAEPFAAVITLRREELEATGLGI